MKTVVGAAVAAIVVFMITITVLTFARAGEIAEAYVICSPDDFVNIRSGPRRSAEVMGRFEAGDPILLDGKKRNGYLHCVGLSLEDSEGWIHAGYVVTDQPELVNEEAVVVSRGRLAARQCVDGKRLRWLKTGARLKVYYWSNEWACTSCGYVRSEYLELDGV